MAYRLGRVPTRDERTAELRLLRAEPGGGTPRFLTGSPERAEAGEPAEATLNLPADFWQQRPYLAHIYQAAIASDVAPDGVLMAWLSLYSACLWPSMQLPGGRTLDFISVNVGDPAAGKSKSYMTAYDLLPEAAYILDKVRLFVPVGSGEGMTEIFIHRIKGKQSGLAYRGVGFYADEGEFVANLIERPGNTTAAIVRSAWMGANTGQTNADEKRVRFIPPRSTRVGLTMSITPVDAARFLVAAHVGRGTPQRFCWGWLDRKFPGRASYGEHPPHPGRLDVPLHDYTLGCASNGRALTIHPDVDRLIYEANESVVDPLEGHVPYGITKAAALLMLMDDRSELSVSDWDLGVQIYDNSRMVREHVARIQVAQADERHVAAGRASAVRQDSEYRAILHRAVEAYVKWVTLDRNGIIKARQSKDYLRRYWQRHQISHKEIIDEAVARALIERVSGYDVSRIEP